MTVFFTFINNVNQLCLHCYMYNTACIYCCYRIFRYGKWRPHWDWIKWFLSCSVVFSNGR